jgi:hypothetical protein
MEPKHLVILGLVGGGAYLYWQHKQQANQLALAAAQKAKDVAGTLRVPKPYYVMTIPRTKEELDTVDKFLCECVNNVDLDAPSLTLIEDMQLCLASKLYPDFPWPPAPGDHESAMQLWLVLEYRIRSLVNNGDLVRLCLPKPPVPDIPVPLPEPKPHGLNIPAHTTGS